MNLFYKNVCKTTIYKTACGVGTPPAKSGRLQQQRAADPGEADQDHQNISKYMFDSIAEQRKQFFLYLKKEFQTYDFVLKSLK